MKKYNWNEIGGLEKGYYGERVLLRPLLESDVYPIFMATTNPAFNRYLLWDAPSTVAQLSMRIEKILDERRKGLMGVWVAAEITTGAFVALFRAYTVATPDNLGEFHVGTGIWLHPNYWKGGLSVDVSKLSLDLIFNETPADVLNAETHVDNKASLGLFRAMGLVHSGTVDVEREDGAPSPSHLFRISRSQYRASSFFKSNYQDIAATKEARLQSELLRV
jgi:RimJ/RimL family protein N-acetyltransferase